MRWKISPLEKNWRRFFPLKTRKLFSYKIREKSSPVDDIEKVSSYLRLLKSLLQNRKLSNIFFHRRPEGTWEIFSSIEDLKVVFSIADPNSLFLLKTLKVF